MNAVFIAIIGVITICLIDRIVSFSLKKRRENLKKGYRSFGHLILGRMSNTDVPIVKIRDYLKLTNTTKIGECYESTSR